jgi:hypothetical protein
LGLTALTQISVSCEMAPDCAYRKFHLGLGQGIIIRANQMQHPRVARTTEEACAPRCDWRSKSVVFGSENRPSFFWGRVSVDLLCSRYTPLVAVVKTANLRNRNDGAEFRWVHGPRFRRVLGQRKVRPRFVIIGQE